MTSVALVIAVVGLLLSFSSCGSSSSLTTTSTTRSPVAGHAQAYSAAISELKAFLASWQRDGMAVATDRYMLPSQRGGGITLRDGSVVSYRPYCWNSDKRFILFVSLDLRFSGWFGAWNQGDNGRFVTFHASEARRPYLLEFNTGPPDISTCR